MRYLLITNPNAQNSMVPNKHSPKNVVINPWSIIICRTEKDSDRALVKTKKHDKPENVK